MALYDTTLPYELLLRFDETGSPQGAHIRSRRRVELDGELLRDEILPAAPLALDDFPTGVLMTEAMRGALAQIEALNAAASNDGAQIDALLQQLGLAEAANNALTAQVERLQRTFEQQGQAFFAASASLAEQESENARLKLALSAAGLSEAAGTTVTSKMLVAGDAVFRSHFYEAYEASKPGDVALFMSDLLVKMLEAAKG